MVEFNLVKDLTLTARASYTWQIADTSARRVPEEYESTVSEDIDYQVGRDLGDIIYTSLGASYQALTGLYLKTQYSFQYKEADEYEGSKYESLRYAWMSKDTRQRMHAMQFGITYTTIPLFKKKKFPVPLDFSVISGQVLSGKNVTKDPVVIGEIAMYF